MQEVSTSIDFDFSLIKAGDVGAYENLFKKLYPSLCNYAASFLKEQAAAEEVVQDTFVRLWEKREQLDITTSIKPYLFRAVHNASLNQIKHLNIKEEYKTYNQDQINSNEREQRDYAVESELAERISKAIALLPEERQKVFKLSRFEGLKYKEIAEQLGISVKTVEAQMGKALKLMREELADYVTVLIAFWIYLKDIWW